MPTPKILIIEDSIVSAMMMEATINRKKPGFDVLIAKNIRQGKQYYLSFKPHIVILDLGLPDSSPEESLQAIPYFCRGSCVMIVSAHDYEKDARALGADDYMPKAFGEDTKHFIDRLVALIESKKCSQRSQSLPIQSN